MLMQVRDGNAVADILEGDKILGEMGAKVLQAVAVVVDEPAAFFGLARFACHLHRRRPFHHLARKRLRSFRPRSVGRRGVGHLDVALWTGVVLQHHHVVLVASLHQRGIDAREPWVNHEFGGCKLLKVLGGGIVQPVVVLVLLLSVGELAGDARSPHDNGLPFHVVPEQFRCPDVDR